MNTELDTVHTKYNFKIVFIINIDNLIRVLI